MNIFLKHVYKQCYGHLQDKKKEKCFVIRKYIKQINYDLIDKREELINLFN